VLTRGNTAIADRNHTNSGSTQSKSAANLRRGQVDLEVVVPAYNEAARIGPTLAATVDFLASRPGRSRIVVVDNGSADATTRVSRACQGSDQVSVEVIGCASPGKGAAVRRGLMTSSARYVGFVDADLATPIETLTEAVRQLDLGATAVIASRYAPGATLVQRQPFARRMGGNAFRMLTSRVVPGVHDTQCGFKFFDRMAVQAALTRCRVTGFAFDIELLRHIVIDGGTVAELPIEWTDDARTTFSPVRDGVPAFRAAMRLMAAKG